jgi:hypothetical protein
LQHPCVCVCAWWGGGYQPHTHTQPSESPCPLPSRCTCGTGSSTGSRCPRARCCAASGPPTPSPGAEGTCDMRGTRGRSGASAPLAAAGACLFFCCCPAAACDPRQSPVHEQAASCLTPLPTPPTRHPTHPPTPPQAARRRPVHGLQPPGPCRGAVPVLRLWRRLGRVAGRRRRAAPHPRARRAHCRGFQL